MLLDEVKFLLAKAKSADVQAERMTESSLLRRIFG